MQNRGADSAKINDLLARVKSLMGKINARKVDLEKSKVELRSDADYIALIEQNADKFERAIDALESAAVQINTTNNAVTANELAPHFVILGLAEGEAETYLHELAENKKQQMVRKNAELERDLAKKRSEMYRKLGLRANKKDKKIPPVDFSSLLTEYGALEIAKAIQYFDFNNDSRTRTEDEIAANLHKLGMEGDDFMAAKEAFLDLARQARGETKGEAKEHAEKPGAKQHAKLIKYLSKLADPKKAAKIIEGNKKVKLDKGMTTTKDKDAAERENREHAVWVVRGHREQEYVSEFMSQTPLPKFITQQNLIERLKYHFQNNDRKTNIDTKTIDLLRDEILERVFVSSEGTSLLEVEQSSSGVKLFDLMFSVATPKKIKQRIFDFINQQASAGNAQYQPILAEARERFEEKPAVALKQLMTTENDFPPSERLSFLNQVAATLRKDYLFGKDTLMSDILAGESREHFLKIFQEMKQVASPQEALAEFLRENSLFYEFMTHDVSFPRLQQAGEKHADEKHTDGKREEKFSPRSQKELIEAIKKLKAGIVTHPVHRLPPLDEVHEQLVKSTEPFFRENVLDELTNRKNEHPDNLHLFSHGEPKLPGKYLTMLLNLEGSSPALSQIRKSIYLYIFAKDPDNAALKEYWKEFIDREKKALELARKPKIGEKKYAEVAFQEAFSMANDPIMNLLVKDAAWISKEDLLILYKTKRDSFITHPAYAKLLLSRLYGDMEAAKLKHNIEAIKLIKLLRIDPLAAEKDRPVIIKFIEEAIQPLMQKESQAAWEELVNFVKVIDNQIEYEKYRALVNKTLNLFDGKLPDFITHEDLVAVLYHDAARGNNTLISSLLADMGEKQLLDRLPEFTHHLPDEVAFSALQKVVIEHIGALTGKTVHRVDEAKYAHEEEVPLMPPPVKVDVGSAISNFFARWKSKLAGWYGAAINKINSGWQAIKNVFNKPEKASPEEAAPLIGSSAPQVAAAQPRDEKTAPPREAKVKNKNPMHKLWEGFRNRKTEATTMIIPGKVITASEATKDDIRFLIQCMNQLTKHHRVVVEGDHKIVTLDPAAEKGAALFHGLGRKRTVRDPERKEQKRSFRHD